MQRKHDLALVGVFNFSFVKLAQCFFAHKHAVDNFTGQQGNLGFQNNGLTTACDKFHLDLASRIECHGLFTVVKITKVHMRNMGARGLAPFTHGMRIFTGIVFNGIGCTAIRITFAQNRIYRTTDAL